MSRIALECVLDEDTAEERTLSDYEAERPRWCTGCGDHGVLAGLQRVLKKNDVEPESVVAGCPSLI